MSTVAIVGADTLGGSIAHKIAVRDRFAEVRLIDDFGDVAAGKALDIRQASPLEHFHTKVTAHTNLDAVSDATVIVIAGAVRAVETPSEKNDDLETLEKLQVFNRRAVVVCAGVSHRRLVELGVSTLGIPRTQLIGSAATALQAALQAIVAVELRCSSSEVSLAVLGKPPNHLVVPWSTVTVRGLLLVQQISPIRFSRLKARTRLIWPLGPYTLASATTRVCETIIDCSGLRGLACFAVLDGELGAHRTAAAVTVELGINGVTRILKPSLTVQENVQLETALATK